MDWMYWNMFIFQTTGLLWAIRMRWIRIWGEKMLKWQQAMFSAYLWYFGKKFEFLVDYSNDFIIFKVFNTVQCLKTQKLLKREIEE